MRKGAETVEARVMLTRNLWQACGLVNGAQGYVFYLGWAPGTDWHREPPCVVMVVWQTEKMKRMAGKGRSIQWPRSI
jgi:hypothetical protein